MKKKIFVIVFLLCAIGGGLAAIYYFSSNPSDVASVTASNNTDNNSVKENKENGTSIAVDDFDLSKIDSSKIINLSDSDLSVTNGISEHVRGDVDSSVVFVEYADLQCPGCANMMPYISKIYDDYGDKVAFVFRHYIISGHDNSRSAVRAVEAAGKQGFFWEMLEALYEKRTDWISLETDADLRQNFRLILHSVAPKANLAQFVEDYDNGNLDKKADFDIRIAKELDDISATPTFFLNGEKIDIYSADTFGDIDQLLRSKLDEALAAE